MQALRKAIEKAKGQSNLARLIRHKPQEIYNWLNRPRAAIPAKACVKIEREFPDITRATLRPHDWREIWPELGTLSLTPRYPSRIEWRGFGAAAVRANLPRQRNRSDAGAPRSWFQHAPLCIYPIRDASNLARRHADSSERECAQ